MVEDAVGASGSWIVTVWAAGLGIEIGALHLGHGPVRPAYWSLTLNRALHAGQMTEIGMAWLGTPNGPRAAEVCTAVSEPQRLPSRDTVYGTLETLPGRPWASPERPLREPD